MATTRAKFRLDNYQTNLAQRKIDPKGPWEAKNIRNDEVRTLVFQPVYGNGDPDHENTKFWEASPSGEIRLGVVNREAWKNFELGKEYYIDFTPAE